MGKEAGKVNEIRIDDLKKELDSNTTGIVDKKTSPLLYKVIDEQAKRLGIDLEKEGIKIRISYGLGDGDGVGHNNAAMMVSGENKEDKTLFIGKSYIAGEIIGGGVKGDQIINGENFKLGLLKNTVAHELQHYNDIMKDKNYGNNFSLGAFLKSALFNWGDPTAELKKRECRGDFAGDSKQDINGMIERYSADAFMNNNADLFHPSPTDRVKSFLIKSYIREKTGIELTADDVSLNNHCEFKIINKAKLAAITPGVFREAVKYGEENDAKLKDAIAESDRNAQNDYIKRMGGPEGVEKFERELKEIIKQFNEKGVKASPDHNPHTTQSIPLKTKHKDSAQVAHLS